MRRYFQVYEGDRVFPVRRNYKMKCCDCALVHTLNFKIHKTSRGNVLSFTVYRDDRATAGCRRGAKQKAKLRALGKKGQ